MLFEKELIISRVATCTEIPPRQFGHVDGAGAGS